MYDSVNFEGVNYSFEGKCLFRQFFKKFCIFFQFTVFVMAFGKLTSISI